jgi:hypothetical protein
MRNNINLMVLMVLLFILCSGAFFTGAGGGGGNLVARWGSGAGETDDIRMDHVTNILATIDSGQYHMHKGSHYFFKTFIVDTGGNGSTTTFSFTTPNTSTRIHAKAQVTPDADYTVTIFEGATVSGGTPVNGFNNDRDSSNVAELTALANPTIDVAGTPIWPARSGGGKNPIGVSPGLSYAIIAKTNTTYVFTIVKNISNQPQIVDVDFWWYEVVPKN